MRQQNKPIISKKQTKTSVDTKKTLLQQDNEDFELKISKIQKQIFSLNLDIDSMLQQRKFKENTQKILLKQRKNLENCYLFKNTQKAKQIGNIEDRSELQQNNRTKNIFKDVNQKILQYTKQIQADKTKQVSPQIIQSNQYKQTQINSSGTTLKCQSLHLKQIFNPQQSQRHEKKVTQLRQKLSLLYQKIKLNLQREQPYLHEKILQRIKRQAHKQTRLKLLSQIDRLTKQNSKWMTQQTNRINNQLQQKEIQSICVNNLGLMKKIMSKKVYNNDFIFQNYSKNQKKLLSEGTFPINKVNEQYHEVLKKMHEFRIAKQLEMVKDKKQEKKLNDERNSLKDLLSEPVIKSFLYNNQDIEQQFQHSENQLLEQLQRINRKIEDLAKV